MTEGLQRKGSRTDSAPVTSTTNSGLTWLPTVVHGATQSTKPLPNLRINDRHSKTSNRGGRPTPPQSPLRTSPFPADTARRSAFPASVWSATSVPAADDKVDNLPNLCCEAKPHKRKTKTINLSVRNSRKLFEYQKTLIISNYNLIKKR